MQLSTMLKAAAAALALAAAGPAAAQQRAAADIMLLEGDAPYAISILGAVNAEIHQKSLRPKTPSRQLADEELRRKAAAMGADAVVKIRYDDYNALMSKKGFTASGVAVKFTSAPAATLAAAPPAPAPAPVQAAAAPSIAPAQPAPAQAAPAQVAPAQVAPPQVAQAAPPPPVQAAPAAAPAQSAPPPAPQQQVAQAQPAQAAVAPPPVAASTPPRAPAPVIDRPSQGVRSMVASAGVAKTAPTSPENISLSEADAVRPHVKLGELKAEAHQKSIFTKTPARQMLDQSLRDQAAAMGADAVVGIQYEMNSPLMSKRGSRATGQAIRYQ